MKVYRAIIKRGRPKVYFKRKAYNHWCVGVGKGFPPIQQCYTWKEAIDYAIWWYTNKFIMPLG